MNFFFRRRFRFGSMALVSGTKATVKHSSRSLVARLLWGVVLFCGFSAMSTIAIAQSSKKTQIETKREANAAASLPTDCAKLWPALWEGMRKKEKYALLQASQGVLLMGLRIPGAPDDGMYRFRLGIALNIHSEEHRFSAGTFLINFMQNRR